MTEDKPEIIYPEMLEYAWVKDFDRVKENSKYVKQDDSGEPITADKLPKIPINLVLALLKEAVSYPEVMDAYRTLDTLKPRHGQGKQYREENLLMWVDEYLVHKYGNVTKGKNRIVLTYGPTNEIIDPLREIARGKFDGLDDPRLIEYLKESPMICEDDGNDYNQLPAGIEK